MLQIDCTVFRRTPMQSGAAPIVVRNICANFYGYPFTNNPVYVSALILGSIVIVCQGKNSSLRLLSLSSCTGINHKSLSQLQNSTVADLTLDRTKLDDSSLLALSNFRNLGKIGVSYTDVTADSIGKLCRRLPKLEIVQVSSALKLAQTRLLIKILTQAS